MVVTMGSQAAVRLVSEGTSRRSSAARVGAVLADTYRIERLIAEGGMGTVYECEHLRLQQRFAVKFLDAVVRDDEAHARFRQEAEIAASLDHRSIVQVFDFNTDEGGNPYMVMELVAGQTLGDYAGGHKLLIRDVIRVLDPIASGLEAAHRAGIVHRDLKPSNIMVRRLESGGFEAKLLDFGISKMRDADIGLTRENIVMGTPHYMSPEQAKGHTSSVDARTDIFSLGAILYELLTGRRAFEGKETPKLLHAIAYEHPPSILTRCQDCPPELARVVLRCLAKHPRDRYASVRELMAAVQDAMRPAPPVEKAEPRVVLQVRRSKAGWIAAWAVSLVATAAATVAVASRVLPTATVALPALPQPAEATDSPPVVDPDAPPTFEAHVATPGARVLAVGGALYRVDGGGITYWADAEAAPRDRALPSAAAVTSVGRAREGDVLVGQADGTVSRWDRELLDTTWQRRVGEDPIVALAAEGDYLAVATAGTVPLFNTRTGRLLKRFDGAPDVVALALTRGPGGHLFVVRSRSIDVIDADGRRTLGAVPLLDRALRATLSPERVGAPPELLIDAQQGDWIVRRVHRITFARKGNAPRLDVGPAERL
jgi:serine/threonine-protein kinase